MSKKKIIIFSILGALLWASLAYGIANAQIGAVESDDASPAQRYRPSSGDSQAENPVARRTIRPTPQPTRTIIGAGEGRQTDPPPPRREPTLRERPQRHSRHIEAGRW